MKRLWVILMVIALTLAAAQPTNGRRERSFSERVQFAEDRVLFAFLDDFTGAIERHDWEHVLSHFYEETYLIQTQEFGLDDAEFIIGAMGLDMLDNALIQTTGAESGFAALNQIDTITILERINSGIGAAELQGHITLIDGGKLSVTLFLRQSPTGRYEIVSPVG